MAYNVLKGNVQFINSNSGSIESMVDNYSNQTIAGVKTFSSAITASAGIKSTTNIEATSGSFAHLTISSSVNQTPLLVLEKGETESSFIEFKKEGVKHAEIKANNVETFIIKTEATSYPIWFQQAGNYPLKFQDTKATFESYPVHVSQSLHVTGSSFVSNLSASNEISASVFHGSGAGLGGIPAGALNLGNTLTNDGSNLIVELSNSSGLLSTSNGLGISPNNAVSIGGGSLAGADEFLVADNNESNALRKATITNLQTYMQNSLNFGGAAGSNTQVQFNCSGDFGADSTFTFNTTTKALSVTTLSASSNVSASAFYGDGSNLTGLATNAYAFFTANFSVDKNSDLIGVVTTGSAITASLEAANTYGPGQRFTFKDVSGSCSGSNHIVISASAYGSGNRIDGQGVVKIKAGFGAVTIASDGVGSFYIVSTS